MIGKFMRVGEPFTISGIDLGKNRVIRMSIKQGVIVVKQESQQVWSGIAQTRTIPAEFAVYVGRIYAGLRGFEIDLGATFDAAIQWPTRGY